MVSEEKALKKCPIFQYFLLGVFLKNQRQITHSYLMNHEYQAKNRRAQHLVPYTHRNNKIPHVGHFEKFYLKLISATIKDSRKKQARKMPHFLYFLFRKTWGISRKTVNSNVAAQHLVPYARHRMSNPSS